jgi:uncharacterized protein (DUF2237 family)
MDGSYGGGGSAQLNVLGSPLATCSVQPLTGYFRTGCCETAADDFGSHTVCAQVTAEFLDFSKARGNDLCTPMPAYGFDGLKPGDRWCLCVTRWKEALDAGMAPRVVLAATHRAALSVVTLEQLMAHAIDA